MISGGTTILIFGLIYLAMIANAFWKAYVVGPTLSFLSWFFLWK